MTLQRYQDEGKILNWSSGFKNCRIYDLSGNLSNRLSANYSFHIVYMKDGVKQYAEFDGTTELSAHKQAVEFINNLK